VAPGVSRARFEAAGSRLRLIYLEPTTIGQPQPPGSRLADERDHYEPGSLSRSAYYECKYAMESEVLRAAGALPVVVTNPTAVFGPGDRPGGIGAILAAVARGWGIAWVEAEVNAVDVRDVAEAHVRAAVAARPGERTILGGHNLTVHELIDLAARLAGVPPPRFRLPLAWIDLAVWLGDIFPPLDVAGNHLRAIREWQGYDCSKAAASSRQPPQIDNPRHADRAGWAVRATKAGRLARLDATVCSAADGPALPPIGISLRAAAARHLRILWRNSFPMCLWCIPPVIQVEQQRGVRCSVVSYRPPPTA
jgi:nucleoside-diphosphate-sugar epimerase